MQVMEKFLPKEGETSMASGAFSMQEKRRFWNLVVGFGVVERAEFNRLRSGNFEKIPEKNIFELFFICY